jgi:hypothetical protein
VTVPPVKVRLRLLWEAVRAARGKADDATLRKQFLERAKTSGLLADVHAVTRRGDEDLRHVIDWALKDREPWGSREFGGD